jgi:lysyl-tRNA synthetase, class II
MNHDNNSHNPNEASIQQTTEDEQLDEHYLINERRKKLHDLRQQNLVYQNNFVPSHSAKNVHDAYEEYDKPTLEAAKNIVKISGRMILKRVMGKACFATLVQNQTQIQIYLRQEENQHFELFKHLDLGDILGVKGWVFKTNKGELSIHVEEWVLVAKAIRPLPDKYHGLNDQELRYRQRYVDLMINPEVAQTFLKRSQIVNHIRQFMTRSDFLEVETPMLHPIPGGANAKPFMTHHNALDMQMYLRIAPELYLKRLLVGGFERVFEINRNFRNEGVSVRHNPEFTMMEFYAAYTDYHWLMQFTQKMIQELAQQITGDLKVSYQNHTIDFSKDFARQTMAQAIAQYAPQYAEIVEDKTNLENALRQLKVDLTEKNKTHELGLGELQLMLFEEVAEEKLIQPTYIIDYPIEVSPLARASNDRPDITERFELFVAGRELANGFSELNDPEDQANRFKKQANAKEAGDDEAMYYDQDYITALEYGMPSAGGCGIGIDRLVMLLTNSASIRDVILFPHLRNKTT